MPSMTRTRRLVISGLGVTALTAVFGAMTLPSSPTSFAMPTLDRSGSTPTPTMADDMPGMDMSSDSPSTSGYPGPTDIPETKPTTPAPDQGGGEMSGDMPGMDMPGDEHDHGSSPEVVSNRPLAPVLGTFGGGTSAVMITAGFLRRRDRVASAAKQAARAARKAAK